MGKVKRPVLKVSIPCIMIYTFIIFTILAFIVWLVPYVMLYVQGEESVEWLAQELSLNSARQLDALLRVRLRDAEGLAALHAANFETGVVDWDWGDPTGGEGFRSLLRNSIVTHPQFQFVYMDYEFLPATWGFCGWMNDDKFYYTNMTGWTSVFPAPGGNVTWVEESGFGGNNTDTIWVAPILNAPTGEAWTPIYVVEYESTGVDLYVTFGKHAKKGTKEVIMAVDTNLRYIAEILRNETKGLTFIIDPSTGYLVGSSSSANIYTNVNNTLDLVKAVDCNDTLIAEISSWMLQRYGNYSKIEEGSLIVKIDDKDYFLTITQFSEDKGINWIFVEIIPTGYFLQQIWDAQQPAIYVPFVIFLVVLLCATIATILVVKKFNFVYESAYNQEFDDDGGVDLDVNPHTEMSHHSEGDHSEK